MAGILADRLLDLVPHLDKVFFANSGAESVEAAIKFARAATGRAGIAYCSHAFHGLTYGALSLNGDDTFRRGFEPLLPDCVCVPFNDLAALDRALSNRQMAAFVVEPIQGKGVILPDDDYLKGAEALCRRYDTLFVVDEIQTGIGRTGKFLAGEHWDIEPDMVLLAKALSGGHVPVGAVLMRKAHPRQGVQPHGPRGGARLDLLEERSRDGGRHRDARGAEGRAHLRKRRRDGRAAAAPASRR